MSRNPCQCFSTLSPPPTTMRSVLFPAKPRPLQGINHSLTTSVAFQYVRWLPSSSSFHPLALDPQQHHHIRHLRACLCSLVSLGCDLFHPFQLEKKLYQSLWCNSTWSQPIYLIGPVSCWIWCSSLSLWITHNLGRSTSSTGSLRSPIKPKHARSQRQHPLNQTEKNSPSDYSVYMWIIALFVSIQIKEVGNERRLIWETRGGGEGGWPDGGGQLGMDSKTHKLGMF